MPAEQAQVLARSSNNRHPFPDSSLLLYLLFYPQLGVADTYVVWSTAPIVRRRSMGHLCADFIYTKKFESVKKKYLTTEHISCILPKDVKHRSLTEEAPWSR